MSAAKLAALLALGTATLASCATEPEPFARAVVIERLDQGVGGPKAIARAGDLLLENDHFKVAILAARNSMGPGLFGGSLVDADIRRVGAEFQGGRGADHFMEMFSTVSMNIAEPEAPDDVRIVSDGSDGGEAVIRVEAKATPFLTLLSALWAITDVPDMRMVTDYVAEPGVPWLRMRTAVRVGPSANSTDFGDAFPGALPVDGHQASFPLMDRAVQTGLVVGDFYLSGGSVEVFAPGMGFDEDGLVYRAGLEGRNSFSDPFQFDWIAGIGDGVSYGLVPVDGDAFVPLFTSSQTAIIGGSVEGDPEADDRFRDGDVFSYERLFLIGHGDVGSIWDQILEFRGVPVGTVSGTVGEVGTERALSHVDVFVYEPGAAYPTSMWRTDVRLDDAVPDGSFGGSLPVGTWELVVHRDGLPDSERQTVTLAEGQAVDLRLLAPRGGTLTFTLSDETGTSIPGKVTLLRSDDVGLRRPELGDGFVAGDPEAVLFPLYGQGIVELADGEYTAVASRGLEYELDVRGPFRIDASRSHHVDFVIERSVESEGWISADFHVHAAPSHDSGVALADRVRTMASEGVEFFASSDHDVITDYAPVIEDLGVQAWVQSAVGVETTTVELGHFLGFPLEADFLAESGGAMDWTGRTPFDMITQMRQQGAAAGADPVVFVGHPRAGILGYFDQYGVDPYGGRPGLGGQAGEPSIRTPTLGFTNPLLARGNFTTEFDAMEIMTTKEANRIRTPTQPELDRFAADDDAVSLIDLLTRTQREQQDLLEGSYTLGYGRNGQLDDWFTMLNLGFRFTALANSDTHSMTTTEAGCPRNFVMSGTDDPSFIDDQDVADAVKAHRVVASYGPFVQLWIEDAMIGDELVSDSPELAVVVDVQAPSWMDVDRVELYENGTLIHAWVVEGSDAQRFTGELDVSPVGDAWYVAIAVGDESLEPVFTPVERPIIDLQAVVVEALSDVEAVQSFLSPAVPVPETYPILPYAVTNPIWVDRAGDGFDAPGVPAWMVEPEPAAE